MSATGIEPCAVAAYQALSAAVAGQLAQLNPTGNLVVSSFNVLAAMLLVLRGADVDSEVWHELRAGLQLTSPEMQAQNDDAILRGFQTAVRVLSECDEQVTFTNAASVWANVPIQDAYVAALESELGSVPAFPEVDVQAINGWVSDATEGLIPQLLASLPADVVSVLVAASYFKGTWTYPFPMSETKDAAFTLLDGTVIQTPMMKFSKAIRLHVASDELGSYLVLPFGKRHMCAMVGLPTEATAAGLDALFEHVTSNGDSIRSKGSKAKVSAVIPRFDVTGSSDLVDTFKALGVKAPFEIAPWGRLFADGGSAAITSITHEARIIVNEEGAEAAAATAVALSRSRPRIVQFVADRPFVFTIFHAPSKIDLFTARVVNVASTN